MFSEHISLICFIDNFGPQSSFGDIWYVGIYKLFN